jgi:rRNA biogenesis protein RRP5
MAPIKRKGAAADGSSSNQQKRPRVSSEGTKKLSGAQQKKLKQEKESKDTDRKSTGPQQNSDFSILRDEEPSFPRGGGSVLTPLERKQIQIQATRDVLFEQKGPNNSAGGFAEDDLDEDVDMEDAAQGTVTAKKSRKSKNKKRDDQEKPTKDGVRIEGLSFKVRR